MDVMCRRESMWVNETRRARGMEGWMDGWMYAGCVEKERHQQDMVVVSFSLSRKKKIEERRWRIVFF